VNKRLAMQGHWRNGTASTMRRFELHRAVVDATEPKHRQILHVVWWTRHGVFDRCRGRVWSVAQHVAGIEVGCGLRRELGVVHAWGALRVAVLVHVFQEPADVLDREVALQCPERVRVAEGGRKVRDIAVHHPFVGDRLRQVRPSPVKMKR
jgi:hypothetical protein